MTDYLSDNKNFDYLTIIISIMLRRLESSDHIFLPNLKFGKYSFN